MDSPRLLSLTEAADRLNLTWQHVRRLAASGRIASIKIGRLVRIPHEEIERIAREGLVNAPPRKTGAPATREA
ncbi:MAG: helix-turn-helix domain-containing protein [Myxococcota bacterium]|jgi:excisionase family DNA binding protein|nr:helix-turn-helix domain-containing protein [Myxococcota bacterium]